MNYIKIKLEHKFELLEFLQCDSLNIVFFSDWKMTTTLSQIPELLVLFVTIYPWYDVSENLLFEISREENVCKNDAVVLWNDINNTAF